MKPPKNPIPRKLEPPLDLKLKSDLSIKLTSWLACRRIRMVKGFSNRRLSSLKTGKHLPDLYEIVLLNKETGIPIKDFFDGSYHYILRDNNVIDKIYPRQSTTRQSTT